MKLLKEFLEYFKIGFKIIFTNQKFYMIISVISLVLISIVVYRAVSLRIEVNNIEKNLEEKIETVIEIEYPDYNITSKEGAVYISQCLKAPLTNEELNNNLKSISSELERLFNQSNYNFAFKYKDLYTGFTLSYNSSQPIYAASTIKAPEAIYIYKEAEKGNINLNDELTYTSNYYNTGTGILKNKKFNVNYPVKELVKYSIIYSDNAAHLMLNNKYSRENMYNYWTNLGTTAIFKKNTPWGNITADDATIYMEELYNYYMNQNQYSEELLSYFDKAWKIISTPNNNIRIANKSGWSKHSLHDTALIFDKNPYTLSILTNRGYTEYQGFFNRVSTLIYNFHEEYWNQKYNVCYLSN